MIRERFDLTGKWALVTGASRGIGEATVLALAESGADIVLVSRKLPDLEAVAAKVEKLGRKAHCIPANLGSAGDVEDLCAKLKNADVRPTILINNAATNPAMGTLLDLPDPVWQKIMDVNVAGPLRLCRGIVPMMKKAGGGAIVNVASIGGIRPAMGLGAYGISKAAVIHLTKTLAVELAPHKIRVNCVAPGLVKTKFAEALFTNDAIYQSAIKQIKLHRHGEPEEIAGVILTLASEASSFMTGEIVVADGGATLG